MFILCHHWKKSQRCERIFIVTCFIIQNGLCFFILKSKRFHLYFDEPPLLYCRICNSARMWPEQRSWPPGALPLSSSPLWLVSTKLILSITHSGVNTIIPYQQIASNHQHLHPIGTDNCLVSHWWCWLLSFPAWIFITDVGVLCIFLILNWDRVQLS